MSNPYETPGADSYDSGGMGPDRQAALSKIKPMAMTLLITMAIMMVIIVGAMIFNALFTAAGAAAGDEAGVQLMASGIQGIIQGIMGLIFGGVIIFGCLKMMKLESYGLGMTACILAMIPCFSPCCIIGIPLGIWGIVVLNDANVKACFR